MADVLGPGRRHQPAGLAGGLVDHLEVLALRQADHVEQPGGVQVLDAPADGGQVGGRVAEPAVATCAR